MPNLTRDEQAKIDNLAALRDARAYGTARVTDGQLEEAERVAGWAIENAQARERREQQEQAETAAKVAQHRQRLDERAIAEQEGYKRRVRQRFPGTDAEFEHAWPEILKRWQIEQAMAGEQQVVRATTLPGF